MFPYTLNGETVTKPLTKLVTSLVTVVTDKPYQADDDFFPNRDAAGPKTSRNTGE
jgi:hypothetical protein